jgi:hypothetical protein
MMKPGVMGAPMEVFEDVNLISGISVLFAVGGVAESVHALASRSYTDPLHSHFSHGHNHPCCCHGHVLVSKYSCSAREPSTRALAQTKPMMPFVRLAGRGKKPGDSNSVTAMRIRKARALWR